MEQINIYRILYPRVSEIIGKQNEAELRSVSISVLAAACLRGSKVHEYCTAIAKKLWVTVEEAEYKPYVEAFEQWFEENVSKVISCPVRLFDDERRFSGEPDMIVELKDSKKVALLDIKTSANASKAWAIQLAAYNHLCLLNGFKIDEYFVLHLKKTKAAEFDEEKKVMLSPPVVKPKRIPCDDFERGWKVFESALACYDYFDRKEVKDV